MLLIWNLILFHRTRLRTRQLEEAKRLESIGIMAGGIAHDFKNILMGISGYAELLDYPSVTPEEKSIYLGEILQAVENGTDLTNRILLYSRKTESVMEIIDLGDLIEQLTPILEQTLKIPFSLETRLEQGCQIMGDKTQIKQLIMNLAANGIQSMQGLKDAVLIIELKKINGVNSVLRKQWNEKNSMVMIAVEDKGKGIPEKNQNRIFDPYFTTRTRDKGTGLGLATVHRIVMNHKGEISLHSVENKGTRFEIYLPVRRDP